MIESPVIFSGPMIRALIEGHKTQTRRLVRWPAWIGPEQQDACAAWLNTKGEVRGVVTAPRRVFRLRWCAGMRLWVKETAYIAPPDFTSDRTINNAIDAEGRHRVVGYAASMDANAVRCAEDYKIKKTPSIYMPRWASRIALAVEAVRVERLQDITEDDALEEGVEGAVATGRLNGVAGEYVVGPAREEFQRLWYSINLKRATWASNPWVAVIGFRVVGAHDSPQPERPGAAPGE